MPKRGQKKQQPDEVDLNLEPVDEIAVTVDDDAQAIKEVVPDSFVLHIRDTLDKWIKILRLDHWDIEFRIDPDKCNLDEGGCMACVEDDSSIRYAIIYVNSYEQFKNNGKQPLEQVLIHELLHIKFSLLHPDDTSSLEFKVLHQTIEDLSKSFYRLSQGDGYYSDK